VLLQGGLKLQAWTLAVLPHSLVGHSMTYGSKNFETNSTFKINFDKSLVKFVKLN
jgi:hypothetical protein